MPCHFTKLGALAENDKARFDTKYQTYNRKPGEQDHFSLLEDVLDKIPQDVCMSIEIKDSDIPEASIKTVELIKKYNKF